MSTSTVLTLCVLITLVALSQAKIFYISPFGQDTNSGTKANPLRSLRTALSLATDGDTIIFTVGLHTGSNNYGQTVSKNIKIAGEHKTRSILSCQNAPSGSTGISLEGDAKLTTLSIQRCGYAVRVSSSSSLSITKMAFENNNYVIYTPSSEPNLDSLEVSDCMFTGNSYAIYLRRVKAVNLFDNVISSGGKVDVYYINDLTVTKNIFMNNTSPFLVDGCKSVFDDNIFSANRLSSSSDGSALRISSGSVQVKNTLFSDNECKTGAMYVSGNAQLSITDSKFEKNIGGTVGALYCSQGSGNIFDTTFKENTGDTAGAYYCYGSNCQLFFDGCKFTGNTPDWNSSSCKA